MAKATWRMPEDFLMKVSRLADKTDEILPKVLEAGAADVVCATLARAVTEKEKDGARRGTPV